MNLNGKKILLGVTGGIAAYKSCELLRKLQKKGAEVRVAMTEAATRFVSPLTFASLSKCPVYLKDGAIEARPFQHIDFPRWADLYLVVPCTANAIGKFVYGLADDPVSICFMSCLCPRVIAPAMNTAMYNSPAVQKNLDTLRTFENTFVLESPKGELACGEFGSGRLLEPEQIIDFLEGESLPLASNAAFSATPSPREPLSADRQAPKTPKDFLIEDSYTLDKTLWGYGKKILLTAGRTEELIDPVRYISNRSSGKTAVALASVFLANGFDVQVVAGPMEAEFPKGVTLTRVRSACEMHKAVMEKMNAVDILVHSAAVADYRPKEQALQKIKDSRSQLTLELVPNPNILKDTVNHKKTNQIIIGFALETENFKTHGLEKLNRSGADALLLNTPVATDSGFGYDNVRFALIKKGEKIPDLYMGTKIELAEKIVEFIKEKLEVTNA